MCVQFAGLPLLAMILMHNVYTQVFAGTWNGVQVAVKVVTSGAAESRFKCGHMV